MPGEDVGLLVDHGDPAATAASFGAVGAAADHDRWRDFSARTGRLAAAVWPTMTDPLPRRADVVHLLGDPALVRDVLERPLGEVVEEHELEESLAMPGGNIFHGLGGYHASHAVLEG